MDFLLSSTPISSALKVEKKSEQKGGYWVEGRKGSGNGTSSFLDDGRQDRTQVYRRV